MNAYELADELERLYQQDCIDGVADLSMTESANMLRQQADRIAELQEFAIWMTGCGYDFTQHEYFNKCRDKLLVGIEPPQTKPLSDEEIVDIWFEVAETNSIAERQILFARTIEAKVRGEK